MCREGAFLDQECSLGNRGDVAAGDQVRILVRPHIDRLDYLRLGVVNGVIADEETDGAINPHVAFGKDLVRFGVVAGGIAIDVGVARVNDYVAMGGGDSLLVIRVAGGGDLDRLLLRAHLGSRRERGNAQKDKNGQEKLTHRGCRSYRRRGPLQRQKQGGGAKEPFEQKLATLSASSGQAADRRPADSTHIPR